MANIISYIAAFTVSFFLCLIFSKSARRIALKYKLLPRLRSRDSHKKPVPRIGGLAIFSAFLIVALLWFLVIDRSFHLTRMLVLGVDRKVFGILLAGLLVTGAMFIDDLKGLSAPVKLLVQIGAALIIIASGVGIDYLSNPFGSTINLNSIYIPIFSSGGITYHFSLWSDLLTLIWLVGMMNVINFIDGIDGLAAGISGIAAGTIFLLSLTALVNQPATALLAIILAGASFGFLPENFYPAKLFMGDSGSMFLGLMLGVLPLISGGKLATAFLVLGFPIVDGLVVTITRLVQGKNPMSSPDKTHLHHRFINAGFTTRQAVAIMYGIAALFGWVALRSTTETKLEAGVILVVLLLLMILVLSKIKLKSSITKMQ
jgi:UDP-GlcNAc:undecaprenyl-phosphate GlcNAc-1-phosphate transferase